MVRVLFLAIFHSACGSGIDDQSLHLEPKGIDDQSLHLLQAKVSSSHEVGTKVFSGGVKLVTTITKTIARGLPRDEAVLICMSSKKVLCDAKQVKKADPDGCTVAWMSNNVGYWRATDGGKDCGGRTGFIGYGEASAMAVYCCDPKLGGIKLVDKKEQLTRDQAVQTCANNKNRVMCHSDQVAPYDQNGCTVAWMTDRFGYWRRKNGGRGCGSRVGFIDYGDKGERTTARAVYCCKESDPGLKLDAKDLTKDEAVQHCATNKKVICHSEQVARKDPNGCTVAWMSDRAGYWRKKDGGKGCGSKVGFVDYSDGGKREKAHGVYCCKTRPGLKLVDAKGVTLEEAKAVCTKSARVICHSEQVAASDPDGCTVAWMSDRQGYWRATDGGKGCGSRIGFIGYHNPKATHVYCCDATR